MDSGQKTVLWQAKTIPYATLISKLLQHGAGSVDVIGNRR